MAKATYRMKINGLVVNVGDDIPEYGSLVFTETLSDGTVSIEGNKTDFAKLPTYVKPSSVAYFWDTKEMYKFDGTQWVEQ